MPKFKVRMLLLVIPAILAQSNASATNDLEINWNTFRLSITSPETKENNDTSPERIFEEREKSVGSESLEEFAPLLRSTDREQRYQWARVFLGYVNSVYSTNPVPEIYDSVIFEALLVVSLEDELFGVLSGALTGGSIRELPRALQDRLFSKAKRQGWLSFNHLDWYWPTKGCESACWNNDFVVFRPEALEKSLVDPEVQAQLTLSGLSFVRTFDQFMSSLQALSKIFWIQDTIDFYREQKHLGRTNPIEQYHLLYGLIMGFPISDVVAFVKDEHPSDYKPPVDSMSWNTISRRQIFAFSNRTVAGLPQLIRMHQRVASATAKLDEWVDEGKSSFEIVEALSQSLCQRLLVSNH